MHPQSQKKEKGISLIEVVIYVGLFSLLSVFTIDALFQTARSFSSIRIARDINDSSAKIIERMVHDIRGATSVDVVNSTFDANPGRLTLNTVSASGTPKTVEYFLSGNALHIRENGVDMGSLLSSRTSISGVLFHYINSGTTVAIKIDLFVTAMRGELSATEHFYDTIILRGTY